MKDKHKLSCIIIWFFGFLALMSKKFMILMESRVSEKVGLSIFEALDKYYLIFILYIILLILILIKKEDELKNLLCGIYTSILIPIFLYICSYTSNIIVKGGNDSLSRITYGFGAYILVLSMFAIIIKCKEFVNYKKNLRLIFFLGFITFMLILFLGGYDDIGIMIEYYERKNEFFKELKNHLTISIFITLSSIIISIPLGYISYKFKFFKKIMTNFLNIIESIPTLALICLLLPVIGNLKKQFVFLNMIGISGLGATPVFFALFFYAIFYLTNMIEGGLKTVDETYILVAKSLGMSDFKIFVSIQLPLILPVLISSIRVALIRVISGATIGAYVGYGGLGYFIYLGGSGFAIDMIMLGALPIIVMIFFFDYILKMLENKISTNSKTERSIV